MIALVPRVTGLGTFLTADEKNWVGRGHEFVTALREFRFNDTLITTHPGIPTLWLAGLAVKTTEATSGIPFDFDHIELFVHRARVLIAIANSLLVVALAFAARQVFPRPVARLGSLVIALDPFLIAHSKLVHVDALLAGFSALSLLLLLWWSQKGSAAVFTASAVAGALAILSKIPGVLLLPAFVLLLFWNPLPDLRSWRERLRHLLQWISIASATALVLLPGLLWVPDPVGNVKIVKRDVLFAVAKPHYTEDAYALKPWVYPATLISRTTLPTLAGFLALLALVARPPGARPAATAPAFRPDRRAAGVLLFYLVLFMAGMTLGAKKGDRYLLPIFPVLDLLAVAGLGTLVTTLLPAWPTRRVFPVTAAVVLVPLAVQLVRLGPYQLAHYNWPFPPNLSQELGWGEGLDLVAAYLNRQEDRPRARVASWYKDELRPFVDRPVEGLTHHEDLRVGYVVLYRNMFGRPAGHLANDFLDEYYRRQSPVHTVFVHGLPYAWVYAKPAFSDVIGEMSPGRRVVTRLPLEGGRLRGLEVLLATYAGRANQGDLVVRVRKQILGPDLARARVPIDPAGDNRWVRALFDVPLPALANQEFVFIIETEGTARGKAPTVRVAPSERDAPPFAVVEELRTPDLLDHQPSRGLLGVRLLTT